MRLIYFTRDYSPHDERFLKVLSNSEYKVFLLRLDGKNLASRGFEIPAEISEISWKTSSQMRSKGSIEELKFELAQIFREVKPDLVHAGPLPDCAYLTALAGFHPLVAMSWGYDLMHDVDQSIEIWQKVKTTLVASGALLVDCRATAEKATRMGFPAEKIINFPWGVDLDHFSPGNGSELRKKVGWENNYILLCNRSWEPRYGVDIVLKAFFEAHSKKNDLRLILVGDGSLAGEFNAIVAEADAEKLIHRPGRISLKELPDYYRAANLFVSASHVDGSSVSLLEAMACGKAVAVSDIPANLEWVQSGINGWIFRDGDIDDLALVMVQSSLSISQLGKMGSQNRKVVEQKADWKKNSLQLFNAYNLAKEGLR